VLAAYVTLFIVIPFIAMGYKLRRENFLHNVLSSLTVGSFCAAIFIYLLSMIRIPNPSAVEGGLQYYNMFTPWAIRIGLLVFVGVLVWIFFRKRVKRRFFDSVKYVYFVFKDVYKIRVSFRRFFQRMFAAIWRLMKGIAARPLLVLCLVAGMANVIYSRTSNQITDLYMGTSDLYVHTEWVAQLLGGNIFFNGVYPFAMHNQLALMQGTFGMNLVTIMRFFGSVNSIFIVLSLYLMLKKTFKSRAAIGVAFLFYTISGLIPQGAYERQALTLPQEVGMPFMFLTCLFLVEFLKTKKTKPMALFVMAFTMTIASHFYCGIVTILLVLAILVVHFRQVFTKFVFQRLLLAALGLVVFAIGPLLTFHFVFGIRWEPSMDWAMSVISGEPAPGTTAVTEETVPETLPPEEAQTDLSLSLKDRIIARTKEHIHDVSVNYEKATALNLPQGSVYIFYWCGTVVIGLYSIGFLLFKRRQEYAKLLLSIAGFAVLLGMLIISDDLGIVSIMDANRLRGFFWYTTPLILGGVLEIIMSLLAEPIRIRFFKSALNTLVVSSFFFTVSYTSIQIPGNSLQMQYNAAVANYYKITSEYEPFTWTIVSSVDELSMVRNQGWHYELTDLVFNLAQEEADTTIFIPSDDLFFFVEKRPITPYRTIWRGLTPYTPPQEEAITREMASVKLDELTFGKRSDLYTVHENRQVIMAKVYFWMEAYRKYFPTEITVFYEDDDLVIYHLRQFDPYALNNLYIDYGYNQ
jgi:hypothetical protein